jgi:hypothetical protein
MNSLREIKNNSISPRMPKDFDKEAIMFFQTELEGDKQSQSPLRNSVVSQALK